MSINLKSSNINKINRELIKYIFFGVLTTFVNYIVYFQAISLIKINYLLANIIAWIVSVIFAYITNKYYVFENKGITFYILMKEIFLFFAARIISVVIETSILFIGIEIINIKSYIIKIIASIFVVIINYFLSKYFIFSKKKDL